MSNRRKIKVIAALTLAIVLVGCDRPTPDPSVGDPASDVYSWRDPDTGCNYLIRSHDAGYAGMGGMTSKLRADGRPDCPKSLTGN